MLLNQFKSMVASILITSGVGIILGTVLLLNSSRSISIAQNQLNPTSSNTDTAIESKSPQGSRSTFLPYFEEQPDQANPTSTYSSKPHSTNKNTSKPQSSSSIIEIQPNSNQPDQTLQITTTPKPTPTTATITNITFNDPELHFSITYPSNYTKENLNKTNYSASNRFAEGGILLKPYFSENDENFFTIKILYQRTYEDETDTQEWQANLLTNERECPDLVADITSVEEINGATYIFTKDNTSCDDVLLTSFYYTFNQTGTYLIKITSKIEFQNIEKYISPIIKSMKTDIAT